MSPERTQPGAARPPAMRADALRFAVLGVGLVLLAAPGLTWLDAGELGAAAWELGIPHPTGFPLFALVHKAIMTLLPVGEVAFRGNVASGLIGAAALALAYRAGRRLGLPGPGLALGLCAAALAPAFRLHATTIEVYTGLGLLVSAALLLLARAPGEPLDPRRGVALAFLGGLCLAHHGELRLFGPVLGVVALAGSPALRRARGLALCAAAVGVGCLAVVYLPLRAATEPWRDWGHPATPGALYDHVMATRIRSAYAGRMGLPTAADVAELGGRVLAPAAGLLAVGVLGLVRLARRPGARIVPVLALVDLLYALLVNPMGLRDLQNGLPLMLLLALGVGAALEPGFAAGGAGRGFRGRAVAWSLGLMAVFARPWADFLASRDDRALPALAAAGFEQAPPMTTALVTSDNWAAAGAFVQVVEGARPDVAVLVRQHLWDESSVGPVRRRLPAAFGTWRAGDPPARLPGLGAAGPGESPPVLWEPGAAPEDAGRPDDLIWGFPLARTGRGRATEADPLAAARSFVARAEAQGWLGEPQAQRALSRWFLDAAAEASARDRAAVRDEAVRLSAEAEVEAGLRYAAGLAADGHSAAAAEYAARLAEAHPDEPDVLRAVGRHTLNAGQPAAARAVLDSALERFGDDAEALGLRGVARAQMGDMQGAAGDFAQALRIDPQQPEARAGLIQLQRLAPREGRGR